MNEESQGPYFALIQALLNCRDGEEEQILNAHMHLVDINLVNAIEQVASELIEREDSRSANFLINLSRQLVEVLSLSSTATATPLPKFDTQLDFLLHILRATADGNLQLVYSLLQANLEQLDDNFVKELRNWASARLLEVELEDRQGIAAVIGNFSTLVSQLPLGNRANNQEIALTGYEIIATVFTLEAFPQQWAMNQGNIGNAYFYRILGERAGNLEASINCYEAAFEVYTREAYPDKWAAIQNNLGEVYRNRIRGKKAENLEAAIHCYEAALDILTRKAFPEEWSATQNNLGLVYWERIWGEKAENLEAAIRCYKSALEVRTREAFPKQWADTQNNLGLVYVDRIRGDRQENLEAAICCYEAALQERTRETFPYYWAETQNNLGNVYYHLEEERAEHLEAAICCYEAALKVYNRQALPEQWAMTLNNLGEAYRNRIKGVKAKNLKEAIRCFTDVLEVYTYQAFPQEWAMAQNGLGVAYLNCIQEERAENLEEAIRCLRAALTVRTREALPFAHVVTQFNLGVAYQDSQQFCNAHIAFADAIDTVESLRGEINFGSGTERDKKKLAEEWNDLYQRMVEVCLDLNEYNQAIEYVERSKARNLVELVLSRDLNSIFPQEIGSQLQQIEEEIAHGQYNLQTATADDPTNLAQHLQQLRTQRNDLQDSYLPIGATFKFDQFQKTINKDTAIIEWYVTFSGFQAFILTHDNPIDVLSYSAKERKALEKWATAYLRLYYRKNSNWWRKQLTVRLQKLAQILRLDEVLSKLKNCNHLILIPYQALHLFPLHALPLKGELCLLDYFSQGVRYAPSCQLLQLAEQRQRFEFTHLFAVQNPTNDLTYADLEVEAIKGYFYSSNVIKNTGATKSVFLDSQLDAIHCVHFSCHGYFNPINAGKSALIMADVVLKSAPTELDLESYLSLQSGTVLDLDKSLTLETIFTLNLKQCRLVTLSACETGFIDFNNISDEYIGLPSGFLVAGSSSVVSSLWTVNQLSTAFLMIKFYQNLQDCHTYPTVPIALNQAQIWLRDVTKDELKSWTKQLPNSTQKKNLTLWFRDIKDKTKPFESPYDWAGFCAIGQ